jgi:hypothetical protein
MRLAPRISVSAIFYLSLVGAVFAAPSFDAGSLGAGHTKSQAEHNLLRVAAQNLGRRMPDLVDTRTGLLKNNVRAVCKSRGRRRGRAAFSRFVCVLRPWPARGRQELVVTYRALADARFRVHWLRLQRG